MISIPSFAPSASKPHDKAAKREQNPHYTHYNGLGHSTIAMTMDTYGHLFPRGDDGDALAEAERILLA